LNELEALEGKMFYHEGNIEDAASRFKTLIDEECQDSAVYFLYGLILIEKGQRRQANQYLERAISLEPEFGLYQFRLAENRYLLDQDPADALKCALEYLPEDPWVNNLYGLVLMKRDQHREAVRYFERARELAPAEADIYRNLAQAFLELSQPQRALEIITAGIAAAGEQGALLNQRGTILVALGDLPRAVQEYERALRMEPQDRGIMENCAACCLELDMIFRVEELLGKLLEGRPSAAVYNLNGNLALLKREFHRAEVSYREALKLKMGDPDISCNLVGLHVETNAYHEAKTLLEQVIKAAPDHVKALELQKQIRKRFERSLSCDDCGRVWWVPQNLSPQPGFTLHGEPPGEAPAGACQSCGRIYCIQCAADHVQDGRLKCKKCHGDLKLSNDALKYLIMEYVSDE
jgi:Flp pilus assembly protein TadD